MIFHNKILAIITLYKVDIILVVTKRMNTYLFNYLSLSPFLGFSGGWNSVLFFYLMYSSVLHFKVLLC